MGDVPYLRLQTVVGPLRLPRLVHGGESLFHAGHGEELVLGAVDEQHRLRARQAGDILVWNISYWKNDYPKKDFSKVYATETKGDKSASGNVVQGSKDNFFIAPTAEYYTFYIDLEALTFRWERLENQNPVSYSNISMIGDFNSWTENDGEIDLTAVDPSKHNWYLRHTFDSDTELKFRGNHSWDFNWGYGETDKEWNAGNDWAKICAKDKKNIFVPAGTYDIYFCDITGAAHFVPVE